MQQLPYHNMIDAEFSFVSFVKYYFTQNTMQIHSELSQRYEGHKTQDTEEARWSESSCW